MIKRSNNLRFYLLMTELVAALLGIVFGALLMYVAWDHNPQNEFYSTETGEIFWVNWLPIGIGGFGVLFVPVTILVTLFWGIRILIKKREETKTDIY